MLFAVLGLVRSRLSAPTHPLTRLSLSASRLVPSMDATAARTFATLANSLCSRGIQVGLGGYSRPRLGGPHSLRPPLPLGPHISKCVQFGSLVLVSQSPLPSHRLAGCRSLSRACIPRLSRASCPPRACRWRRTRGCTLTAVATAVTHPVQGRGIPTPSPRSGNCYLSESQAEERITSASS